MYTSGSTGQPKGCMNSHKGVIKLVKNINYLNVDEIDYVFLAGNLIFDASLHEMWLALLNGKTGIIIDKEIVLTYDKYKKIIDSYNNSLAIFSTQLFHQYAQTYPKLFENLKYVISGGEALYSEYVYKVKQYCKNTKIINIYGPAECSAASTTFLCEDLVYGIVPIGKPISNTTCYILDKCEKICPLNVLGELYISGEGVGIGYINDDNNTKNNFVNITINEKTNRMYKTGDLAFCSEDGNIHFVGRKDNQVKIRGYRVEPKEIETAALKIPQVDEVKCIVSGDFKKKLILYYVSSEKLNEENLKQLLEKNIPVYMRPENYKRVDKMPLNYSGKIDWRKLPKINLKSNKTQIEKASTKYEIMLFEIVSNILDKKNIDINENLFEIGLDSINATQICIETMKRNIKLSYASIFENPTIKKLAKCIEQTEEEKDIYDISKYDYSYLESVLNNSKKIEMEEIGNLLLTGANGFLGIHILADFIDNCSGKVFCLVRGKGNVSAIDRLKDVLNFYFGDKYNKYINKRIFIIDIKIDSFDFEEVVNKLVKENSIDTIIHALAKVKHYGDIDEFYKLNIEYTQKIIDITKKNNIKLIHISTLSVSGNGLEGVMNTQKFVTEKTFDERSLYIGQRLNNVYTYSKFEAEIRVLEAIKKDKIKALVLRVGNLMGRYSDGVFQRNVHENSFIDRIKFIAKYKCISEKIVNENYLEFTPVDLTASAIIKIAKSKNIDSYIYHLYNHRHYSIKDFIEFLNEEYNIDILVLSEEKFNKKFKKDIKNDITLYNPTIIADMDKDNKLDYSSSIKINSTISINKLNDLDFKWQKITKSYLKMFCKSIDLLGEVNN